MATSFQKQDWIRPAGPVGFDGDGGIDLDDPAVKAAVEAAAKTMAEELAAKEAAGLKKNRDDLVEEKRKVQEMLSAAQEQLKSWEGLGDADQVKKLISHFQQSEEAQLIADGKLDVVLERRTEAMRADFDGRLKAATEKIEELSTGLQEKDRFVSQLVIGNQVRDAAGAVEGFQQSAVADAVVRALGLFSLDKDNNPIAFDSDGKTPKMGKDGKSTLSVTEWLETELEQAPHWRASSQGGGANGGAGDIKFKGNAEEFDKLSPNAQMSAAITGMTGQE